MRIIIEQASLDVEQFAELNELLSDFFSTDFHLFCESNKAVLNDN